MVNKSNNIISKYKGEEVKAFCYIYKDKDEKSKCLLTDQNLVILVSEREYIYPLTTITKMGYEHKYSMFPLISGGIILPFSLIAIFTNLYDPWILIYLFVSGMLIFYSGWVGHYAIRVHYNAGLEDNLKIKKVTEPLKAFTVFVNEVLKMGVRDKITAPRIYHIVSGPEWELQKSKNSYAPDSLKLEGFIHCSQKEQLYNTYKRFFKDRKDLIVLTIDPLKVKSEIKYEAAKDASGLFPHIYGSLNLDAVEKEEMNFFENHQFE